MKVIKSEIAASLLGGLFIVICSNLVPFSVQGQLLDSEGFNYSAGDVVGDNGGTGWSGAWANPANGAGVSWGETGVAMGNRKSDASVASPGLSYSSGGYSLNTSGGNALSVNGASAYRPWNTSSLFSAAGQSLWVSFLLDPSATTSSANTLYVLPFAQNNSAVAANYQDGSGAKFNTDVSGTWNVTLDIPGTQNGSGYTTPTPLALTLSAANLIVMEFTYNGSGADTIQLWVDPTLGGSAPLGTDPNITATGWLDQTGEFMVKSGSSVPGELGQIDIGDTYAAVTPVPEPGTIPLALLGAVSSVCALRRCRLN